MSELFNAIKEQGRHISSLRGGYGTSDAISSLDELVDRVEAENKALCIELDMSLVDSETYKDYILKLEAENEAFKKEIACLKTVPMKYRRMAFNARLQKENEALRTKLQDYATQLGIMTVEKARQLFRYEPETGYLYWKVSQGTIKEGALISYINCKGYLNVKVGHKSHQVHRIIWMVHYGELPPSEIDHINRIKSDNRIENLRAVTHSENLLNQNLRSDNKSGHIGVYKVRDKWTAQIRKDGKAINLGTFSDIESAIHARKIGEQRIRAMGDE